MQKWNGSLLRKFDDAVDGNASVGTTVVVRNTVGNTLAVIYDVDDTNSVQKNNPFVTDDFGRYSFYAPNGKYTIEFGDGSDSIEITLVDNITHNGLLGLDAAGGHDAIYSRVFNSQAEMVAYTGLVAGNKVQVSESGIILDYEIVDYESNIDLGEGLWAKLLDNSDGRWAIKVDGNNASDIPNNINAAQVGNKIISGLVQKISTYGDSTMYGATVGSLGTQNPDQPAQSLYVAILNITGTNNPVNNRAISGSTLNQMLNGTDGSGSTYASKLESGGIDDTVNLVYMNHGINDNTAGLGIDQYKSDLVEFVQITRKNGKCPVLVTPVPAAMNLYSQEANFTLASYVDTMRLVAKQMGVDLVDQYYYLTQTANQVTMYPTILGDGVHPTTRCYIQLGYNMLIPLIRVKTLYNNGDSAGLYDATWLDNLTSARTIFQNGARTTATITGNKNGTSQGVNYPVIFDAPKRTFSVIGLQWAGACKCELIHNNSVTTRDYYNLREFGSTTAEDWDSDTKFHYQVWAGLQIFGLFINNGDSGTGDTLAFSGIAMTNESFNCQTNKARYWMNRGFNAIANLDTIVAPNIFIAAAVNYVLVDKQNNPVLDIIRIGSDLVARLYVNGATTTTATIETGTATDRLYDIQIIFSDTSIIFFAGDNTVTMTITSPMPNMMPYNAYRNDSVSVSE